MHKISNYSPPPPRNTHRKYTYRKNSLGGRSFPFSRMLLTEPKEVPWKATCHFSLMPPFSALAGNLEYFHTQVKTWKFPHIYHIYHIIQGGMHLKYLPTWRELSFESQYLHFNNMQIEFTETFYICIGKNSQQNIRG